MKIIFSPSKSQERIESDQKYPVSQAQFLKQSRTILNILSTKTKKDLKNILNASPAIINQVYADIHDTTKKQHPALLSFSGTSFSQLDLHSFTHSDMNFAQEHLRILSARYGVLRPFDQIQAYRLDMNNPLFSDSDDYQSLYDFWREAITTYFKNEDLILNLASNEYATMLKDVDQSKITNVHFLVRKTGKLKNVAVYAKQERGKLLNYIIKKHITDVSKLKKYSSESFVYDKKLSDPHNLYFIKEEK